MLCLSVTRGVREVCARCARGVRTRQRQPTLYPHLQLQESPSITQLQETHETLARDVMP